MSFCEKVPCILTFIKSIKLSLSTFAVDLSSASLSLDLCFQGSRLSTRTPQQLLHIGGIGVKQREEKVVDSDELVILVLLQFLSFPYNSIEGVGKRQRG